MHFFHTQSLSSCLETRDRFEKKNGNQFGVLVLLWIIYFRLLDHHWTNAPRGRFRWTHPVHSCQTVSRDWCRNSNVWSISLKMHPKQNSKNKFILGARSTALQGETQPLPTLSNVCRIRQRGIPEGTDIIKILYTKFHYFLTLNKVKQFLLIVI